VSAILKTKESNAFLSKILYPNNVKLINECAKVVECLDSTMSEGNSNGTRSQRNEELQQNRIEKRKKHNFIV
jgi:hypothetical protein